MQRRCRGISASRSFRQKSWSFPTPIPRPAASSIRRSRREGRLMVGALLKPLSALSVASATSNLPPVRPVPDRAVDARRISLNSFNSSKRRARGRVLTPHPPLGSRIAGCARLAASLDPVRNRIQAGAHPAASSRPRGRGSPRDGRHVRCPIGEFPNGTRRRRPRTAPYGNRAPETDKLTLRHFSTTGSRHRARPFERRQLKDRRLLTPYLLNHGASTIVGEASVVFADCSGASAPATRRTFG